MPLTFVPTPIGNLDDITLRAIKTIEEAEVVFCEDTRVVKKLFELLSKKLSLCIKSKIFYSLHSHNENELLKTINPSIFEKKCIYLSDAGMPCISDPGAKLVEYLRQNCIEYDVLPGPSAATTAYAASGFLESKYLFYGFLPHKSAARMEELSRLCGFLYPVVFYESPHRIGQLAKEIGEIDPYASVFAAKELTKMHQRYISCKGSEFVGVLNDVSTKGEWVVVVLFSKTTLKSVSIELEELMKFDLPKKQLAKLISRATGESPKKIYESLL